MKSYISKAWSLFGLTLLALSLFTTSCNKEIYDEEEGQNNERYIPGENEMVFDAEVLKTYATTGADFKTTFDNGDAIGVYVVKRPLPHAQGYPTSDLANYVENAKFTYNKTNNQWVPATPIFYPPGGEIVDVYAYYPYKNTPGLDPNNIQFSVTDDQSTPAKFNANDFMTARKIGVSKSSGEITIPFEHKFSLMHIEVTNPEGLNSYPTADLEIELENIFLDAVIKLGATNPSDEVTIASGATAKKVKMVRIETDNLYNFPCNFRAIVPSQTIDANNRIITIKQEGESFKKETPSDIVLNTGTAEIRQIQIPLYIKTVDITGGTFLMGSPATEAGRLTQKTDIPSYIHKDEKQRTITISDFKMGKYEISNALFAAFLNDLGIVPNPSYPSIGSTYAPATMVIDGEERVLMRQGSYFNPDINQYSYAYAGLKFDTNEGKWVLDQRATGNTAVTNVTWIGAKKFCEWYGNGCTLPSEAQWEYACRAGSSDVFWFGNEAQAQVTATSPEVTTSDAYAFYNWGFGYTPSNQDHTMGTYLFFTRPQVVGYSQLGNATENPFGLYNMHGNASEWCLDYYDVYSGDNLTNPVNLTLPDGNAAGYSYYKMAHYRVLRGGSWLDKPIFLRSAAREPRPASVLPHFSNPSIKLYNDYSTYSTGFRVVFN